MWSRGSLLSVKTTLKEEAARDRVSQAANKIGYLKVYGAEGKERIIKAGYCIFVSSK
jgi:hypothetical protein